MSERGIRSTGRRFDSDWLWRRSPSYIPRDPLLRALVAWGIALQAFAAPELNPALGIKIPEVK